MNECIDKHHTSDRKQTWSLAAFWSSSIALTVMNLVAPWGANAQAQGASNASRSTAPALTRLEDPGAMVIAHRGCWRDTAENSLAGIQACIERGIDAVELDVQATKDGEPILFHDDRLDRTTDRTGLVTDYVLAQLSDVRLRKELGGPGADVTEERIPRLARALGEAKKGRLVLLLEVKCKNCEAAVVRAIEAERAQDWVILQGNIYNSQVFHAAWAKSQTMTWVNDCELRALVPDLTDCFDRFADGVRLLAPGRGNIFLEGSNDTRFFSETATAPEMSGIQVIFFEAKAHLAHLSREEIIRDLRRQWDVFLQEGSPSIITDYPDELLAFLKERGRGIN